MMKVDDDSRSRLSAPPPGAKEHVFGLLTAAGVCGGVLGFASIHTSDAMGTLPGAMSPAAIDQVGERYTRALRDLTYPQKSLLLSINDARSQLYRNILNDETPGDRQKNVGILQTLDTTVYQYSKGESISNTLSSARSDIEVVQSNMHTVQSANESIQGSMFLSKSLSVRGTTLSIIDLAIFGPLYVVRRRRRTSGR